MKWERMGVGNIYEFAAKLAGMSKESVGKVATIATSETDGDWAERMETLSQPAAPAFVQNYRVKTTLQSETQPVKPVKYAKRSVTA